MGDTHTSLLTATAGEGRNGCHNAHDRLLESTITENIGICIASIHLPLLRIRLQCRRPWFNSWVRKIHWRKDKLPTPVFLVFPGGSNSKQSTCNAGDLGLIPGLGRSLEKGMAPHSSILAWRIAWTEEPGGLQSMGSQRVGHS